MRLHRTAVALTASPAAAPADMRYEELARLFKLLGEPTRLKVLTTLLAGECSVGDIARATGVPAATVSRAMAPLFQNELLARRRADGAVHYRLATPRLTGR